MGRSVSARTLGGLLAKLWKALPRVHIDVPQSQRILQDIDFVEVIEAFAIMIHVEKADLRCFLMEVGNGLIDLYKLGVYLKDMEFGLDATFENLKEAAEEFGVEKRGYSPGKTVRGSILAADRDRQEMLYQIVMRCHQHEKQEVHERAGFSREEVGALSRAFDKFSTFAGELDPEDLLKILDGLGILLSSDKEQQQHLLEVLQATSCGDIDTISFNECLHLVRRFFDEAEVQAVLLETSAQEYAELSSEDVEELRKVYHWFADEEVEQQGEFNYFALTKAVRFLGGSALSIAQSAVLDEVFRKYSKPSRTMPAQKTKSWFYLPFPEFLKVTYEVAESREFKPSLGDEDINL